MDEGAIKAGISEKGSDNVLSNREAEGRVMSVTEPRKTKCRDRAQFTHDKHSRKERLVDCHKNHFWGHSYMFVLEYYLAGIQINLHFPF